MSVFHFVASAGRLLSGTSRKQQDASHPVPTPPSGNAILNEFKKLGLTQLHGLNVRVVDRTAHVTAVVPDAQTRETVILAAGNIAGIDRVDAQITVPQSVPVPTFHTVKDGETLSDIAEHYHGNPDAHPELLEANSLIVNKTEGNYAGQVIRIPDKT